MAEVVLERVSREFPGGTLAVDSVCLEVHDKELMVLVGPSGCGKTTTLRMIAGLEEISSGTIRIGERVVNDVAPRDRDIAMVFQNYALYPHMTVRGNMAFGLELRNGGGWPWRLLRRIIQPGKAQVFSETRREIDAKVRSTAQTLGIEHLLERLPRQLSGGERQRVALGRAMVRQPAAFLFDEPLSNLDAKLRIEMRRELKQLHERLGATMIYVTHDQVEALTLGQRVAVMHEGTVQQVGTAMEVYQRPVNQFVAGFIGSPPMNFVSGTLGDMIGESEGRWVFQTLGREVILPTECAETLRQHHGTEVVLGVRPEDLKLGSGDSEGGDGLLGQVSAVEPLGDAKLVYVELVASAAGATEVTVTGAALVSKVGPRSEWAVGQSVQIGFDHAQMHWFDADSGRNLRL